MEINTKFNVGDHVNGISYKHQLVAFDVAKIAVSVRDSGIEINYYPSDGKGGYDFMSFDEKYCFATKDEALAYIQVK